jgi:protein gp37
MAENTKIEWATHTFNPWVGCTKISPACDNCYAADWARRYKRDVWGAHAPRQRTSRANWRLPLKWNEEAKGASERPRVFCASLADVFDNHASITSGWRGDLWHIISQTPNLDWLLLTKRHQNIKKMLPETYGMPAWGTGWDNVWLGTTTENQKQFDTNKPHLISVPARVHFLSMEPLLEAVSVDLADIEWCIAGGESGKDARPMHPDWARSIRDQCKAAGVAFHFKQWGEWVPQLGSINLDDDPEQSRFKWAEWENGMWYFINNPQWCDDMDPDHSMIRVGKHRAGDFLDGIQHHAFPQGGEP